MFLSNPTSHRPQNAESVSPLIKKLAVNAKRAAYASGLLTDYWHQPQPPVPGITAGNALDSYYIDYRGKAAFPGRMRDGVPVTSLGGDAEFFNPITIAQYALGHYLLRRSRSGSTTVFMRQADWLLGAQSSDGAWHYNAPAGDVPAPWRSAMAQGEAISVLVRAARLTKDVQYLLSAERALKPFRVATTSGGVLCYLEGSPWYEEYACAALSPPFTLNGFIVALLGLFDMHLASPDAGAKSLFDNGVETLLAHLSGFDIRFWSTYDLATIGIGNLQLRNVASPFYHRWHSQLLTVMHALTGNALFESYAARWEQQSRSAIGITTALMLKGLFRVARPTETTSL